MTQSAQADSDPLPTLEPFSRPSVEYAIGSAAIPEATEEIRALLFSRKIGSNSEDDQTLVIVTLPQAR